MGDRDGGCDRKRPDKCHCLEHAPPCRQRVDRRLDLDLIVGTVADIVRPPLDVSRGIARGDNVGRGAGDPIPGVPRQYSHFVSLL